MISGHDASEQLQDSIEVTEIKIEKTDPDLEEIIDANTNEIDAVEEIDFLKVQRQNINVNTKELPLWNKKHKVVHSPLLGLLPSETETCFAEISKHPVVVRCCIEHSYFIRDEERMSSYGNSRHSLANGPNTLPFPNETQDEQQTIDFKRFTSRREVISLSGTDSSVRSNYKNKSKPPNDNSNRSNSDSECSAVGKSRDRVYCRINSKKGASENASTGSGNESGDLVKRFLPASKSNSNQKTGIKTERNDIDLYRYKKLFARKRLGTSSNYPITKRIQNNFVSVNDILSRVRRMQKLMRTKYEKKFNSDSDSNIPLPKLKRMISRSKTGDDLSKMSDYFLPMPSLTKMGNKNWKVSHVDGEVQSLGLDDLLLKASELNAENFTKALGRKLDSVKSNFTVKDGSEIVLTVPKTKPNSMDSGPENVNGDHSKRQNLKSVKLDFTNSYYELDRKKIYESGQNGSKGAEESSPRKLGIKVKTVENINEEFKDSLELKKTSFKDCNKAPMDLALEGKSEITVTRSSSPSKDDKHKKKENQESFQESQDKKKDEDRPFIMTIVQGKSEKQRPAILRNSSYFKKKTNSIEEDGERLREMVLRSGAGTTDDKQDDSASDRQNPSSETFGSKSKVPGETPKDVTTAAETIGKMRYPMKKKNIPFILNHNRKSRESDFSVSVSPSGISVQKQLSTASAQQNKLVKASGECSERQLPSEKVFKVTSIEQKLGPKETNRRFIKLVPYEPVSKTSGKASDPTTCSADPQTKNPDEEPTGSDTKVSPALSLSAFSTLLKGILPDKWFLCMDKKYGLQIIKTHMDEVLNPSILISVVIAKSGKLTVNVRGKQLEKSHQLFSNLSNMSNSENKLSLIYVLDLLSKLKYLSVCTGCDGTLKKYFPAEGHAERQADACRSRLCHQLVSLGRKRCYPCYRMNESLKKRHRKEKAEGKSSEVLEKISESPDTTVEEEEGEESEASTKHGSSLARGVKRNLEDFLEESFSTMKQQIADEIERNKKLGEKEDELKTQEEVLSSMGLTRKDNLGNSVRKSKRKKNSFYKSQQQPQEQQQQQQVKKKIDQKELEFLEKYWADINTLFSTSLLFGAYSRTGRSRLRDKCRMFRKLLSTWRDIVKTNPEWIGGDIVLPDDCQVDGNDQFDKMDVTALRAFIINSVKEVNRIKHKLRTRNSYFKVLYNKFVKRRMKRPKLLGSEKKKDAPSSANSTATNTPTDLSSDESSRERGKATDESNHTVDDSVAIGDVSTVKGDEEMYNGNTVTTINGETKETEATTTTDGNNESEENERPEKVEKTTSTTPETDTGTTNSVVEEHVTSACVQKTDKSESAAVEK